MIKTQLNKVLTSPDADKAKRDAYTNAVSRAETIIKIKREQIRLNKMLKRLFKMLQVLKMH